MLIKQKLSLWAKRRALEFGIVVKRSNYYTRQDLRLVRYLELNGIDTILDVGANCGDYAASLIDSGFKGRIYSFEALPDMHNQLLKRTAESDGSWIVAPRCAISDEAGAAQFHVTNAISSSSLLRPSETATEMPDIFGVRETIEVTALTISEACKMLGITSNRIFLKLDIQGGEERALKGADPIMSRVAGMVVEMPLQTYYDGQASARKLDAWIVDRGYDLWDIQSVWRNPKTGRLDHIDATYFRNVDSIYGVGK